MATDEHERMLRRQLADAGERAPLGDPDAAWQRTTCRIARRRRRRRAMSAASLALVVVIGAAAVPAVVDELQTPDEAEVVLEPAPVEDAGAGWEAPLTDVETPEDAPSSPPVAVPHDWETVELGDALITVPPEWAQIDYRAGDDEPACPEGEPALIVSEEARPAGCGATDAAMSEGLVVAPANVAHEVVGAVAADGERVQLPALSVRGLAVDASPLLAAESAPFERDALVVPGIANGLLVEAVGGEGVVEALAAGDVSDPDPTLLHRPEERVRLALATLRPAKEADPGALVVGRHDDRVVTIAGDGRSRALQAVPSPVLAVTLADEARGDELAAVVHAGADPVELLVLAGDRDRVGVVHRTTVGVDDDREEPAARIAAEAVWAEGRAYVAWLEPAGAGVLLHVVGWTDWDDLIAGQEPDADTTVALEVPDDLDHPLAPVVWHEHGDGQTTLELGLRSEPEGFGREDRWGLGLRFDDDDLDAPDRAELRPLEP